MTLHLHLTVNGASPDWLDRFLAEPGLTFAATEPAHPVPVHAVHRLLTKVSLDGAYLLRLAADSRGRADCAVFRATRGAGRELNAAAGSITKQVNAAVKGGWWPAEYAAVLTPTGPGPNGWSKTTAYHMDTRLIGVFGAAFAQTETPGAAQPIPPTTSRTAARLAALAREASVPEHLVDQFVDAACALHSVELGAALRVRGQSAAADLLTPDPALITGMWEDENPAGASTADTAAG
ncbi:hypothetical protein [Streptomyces sp. NBC_01294]|uniref:hypothetical protein n=1 Tax=Streptomyces sp. NBC_01294 TaxID=2903815 RepID=UPI002DD7A408|nr:hypothetical protein [Streptomyces sp. NBC_01294]WRZ62263.1 hypothetical protein OG534_37995 [Streptomyces sp. NBC_01294]